MANLVIVESPSKANTIKGYLGSNYKVIASKGHVRDLPKSTLGVDIEGGFEAHYINIRGKGDLIKSIKKDAKNANKVFLATDPDREGEAISWHLANALGIPVEKTRRVTFNEITKTAIKAAIKNPRNIDMDLVNSQQARRILDRIVGYKLSPLLWKSVKSGLSAGRVQSRRRSRRLFPLSIGPSTHFCPPTTAEASRLPSTATQTARSSLRPRLKQIRSSVLLRARPLTPVP